MNGAATNTPVPSTGSACEDVHNRQPETPPPRPMTGSPQHDSRHGYTRLRASRTGSVTYPLTPLNRSQSNASPTHRQGMYWRNEFVARARAPDKPFIQCHPELPIHHTVNHTDVRRPDQHPSRSQLVPAR